jgi:GT2 family glycosyltransferase
MAKVIAFRPRRPGASDVPAQNPRHDGAFSSTRQRSDQPDSRMQQEGNIMVSIVVPTCGRPVALSHCLASLLRQDFDCSRFEIIVVDDRPSPDTREVVHDWAMQAAATGPVISYLASDGPHGSAAARNKGWRVARGAIIAFTDDDTVARPQWLTNGLQKFEHGVQAVLGRIVMPLDRIPADYGNDAEGLESTEFVTANCFCTRQALERINGFDERFRCAGREGADLYFRLLAQDGRVLHAPAAVIVHPIRPAGWGASISQQKNVLFDALLYKKHPDLYRQEIRHRARWDYYLIVAALIATIVALVMVAPAVAGATATVWVLLTGRLCTMRLRATSRTPVHIAQMVVASAVIPPLSVFWRLVGALRFRVPLL